MDIITGYSAVSLMDSIGSSLLCLDPDSNFLVICSCIQHPSAIVVPACFCWLISLYICVCGGYMRMHLLTCVVAPNKQE